MIFSLLLVRSKSNVLFVYSNFADPIYQGVQADLFYCGPAAAEKALVEQLIAEIGLRPIYLGDSNVVEVVDGVIRLWAALVRLQDMGMDHVAFKVLTR